MKRIKDFLFIILLVGLDQITKIWAKTFLQENGPISVIPNVFEFHYLENRGAAFGMLQNKIIFFVILTVVVVSAITYLYIKKIPNEKKYTPIRVVMLFIIAGAIGNLIDRVIYNFVVDFLYFKLINFPIFNVADCYVTISAAALAFLLLFYYKEEDFDFLTSKKIEEIKAEEKKEHTEQ